MLEKNDSLIDDYEEIILQANDIINQAQISILKFQEQDSKLSAEVSKYNGVKLVQKEILVLKELESLLEIPIPVLKEVSWNAFGFLAKKNHITGL